MARQWVAVASALTSVSVMATTAFASSPASVPPKTYTATVHQMNLGHLDTALQSAQQTISNQPNSIYAYRSYVLEAVILRAKMFWMSQTFGGLISGLQAKNSSKLTVSDKTYLTNQAKGLLDLDTKTYFPQYLAVVQHVVEDMPTTDANYKYNLSFKHDTDSTAYAPMAAFKQDGYPALTKDQLSKFETANEFDGYVYFESVLNQGMPQSLYDFAVGTVQNEPTHGSGLPVIKALCGKIKLLLNNQPNEKLSSEVDALLKTAQSG